MPYIQRNEAEEIVALYAVIQPELAEEFLPEDDAEVIAFRAGPDVTEPTIEERLDDFETRIAALEGVQ